MYVQLHTHTVRCSLSAVTSERSCCRHTEVRICLSRLPCSLLATDLLRWRLSVRTGPWPSARPYCGSTAPCPLGHRLSGLPRAVTAAFSSGLHSAHSFPPLHLTHLVCLCFSYPRAELLPVPSVPAGTGRVPDRLGATSRKTNPTMKGPEGSSLSRFSTREHLPVSRLFHESISSELY